MKKKVLAFFAAVLMLVSGLGVFANNNVVPTNHVQAAGQKYGMRFYKVRITKKTLVYKVHPGKYEYMNKYTKAYYLRPGKTATIRARGNVWGWTIGKSYKYCSMRDSRDYSWFKVIK